MYKPKYDGGSIVNLVSSIRNAYGVKSLYKPLDNLELSNDKKTVLIIIDGLGYHYLLKYGKKSYLYKNLKYEITSVFPATTVSAITSFSTGLAPQQHAMTGWFMYLKELGMVSAVLPFVSRAGRLSLDDGGVDYKEIYDQKTTFEELDIKSYSIKHSAYINSPYSRLTDRGAQELAFEDLDGFIENIKIAIKGESPKFVMAYWAMFDAICHEYGTDSDEALTHFREIDNKLKKLIEYAKNQNTTFLITADHGLMDTKDRKKVIELQDHPSFTETLIMPISGESRAVYCYVRPNKVRQFESYVKNEFKNYCDLYESKELVKEGFFGLYKINQKLLDRIGDYILIMKEDYIMKDFLPGEGKNIYIGNHGGVSKEEMLVPLIVVE